MNYRVAAPLLCAILALVGVPTYANAALPIDVAALQPNFGEHAVLKEENQPIGMASPDGTKFAYTQCMFRESDPSKNGLFPGGAIGCAAVIADSRTGAILHRFAKYTSNPIWSPDGMTLAFYCPIDDNVGLCIWSARTGVLRHYPGIVLDYFYSTVHWISNTQLVVDGANALLPGELPRTVYPVLPEEMTTPVVYRTPQNIATDPQPDPYQVPPISTGFLPSHGPRTLYLADVDGSFHKVTTMENTPTSLANADAAPNVPFVAIAESSGLFSTIAMHTSGASLRIVDPRTGATVRTFDNLLQNGDTIAWSPVSSTVAWYGQDTQGRSIKIFGADVHGNTVRTIASIPTKSAPPRTGVLWSNDGARIYTITRAPSEKAGFAAQLVRNILWVTEVTSGRSHLIFSNPNERIVFIVPEAQRTSVAWSPSRSHAIVLVTQNLSNFRYSLVSVDPQSGSAKRLLSEDALYNFFGGDTRGENIYFLRQRADLAQDIYAFNPSRDTSPRPITHVMDRFRQWPLGKSTLLSYTVNGEHLHAALLLPPGYRAGTRLPTVVYLYGGSYNSIRLNQFGLGEYDTGLENLQVLATRGIAVLVPDTPYRGNDLIEEDVAHASGAMDRAVALGYSDPQRFGVMGHSHGGYDVYALMAASSRFKAGVARAGLADWTNYGTELNRPHDRSDTTTGNAKATTAMPRYGLGVDLWTNPQRYLAESPIYRFNHVTGAVLIIHGGSDANVLPQQAEAAFSALLQLNKNAELAIYPSGNHTEDTWPMKYQIDYLHRMVDWFQRYLR